MEIVYKFKTSINCNGCVGKVTPFLNNGKGISRWEVDIADAKKILTVVSSGINEQEIVDILRQAGFKAERIPS